MVKKKKPAKSMKFLKENSFLIISIIVIALIGTFISLNSNKSEEKENLIFGDDRIDMYYFHLNTCPHCHEQNKFNEKLKDAYPNLNIIRYEMTEPASVEKYKEIASKIDGLDPNNFPGTPLTVINDKYNIGFGTPETTGLKLIEMIEEENNRINSNWNESSMKRTIDLRNSNE